MLYKSTILAFCVYFIFSCNSIELNTNPDQKVRLSSDTIFFDTVFQAIGSATKSIKIYNPTSEEIIISKASLVSENSSYRFNINGMPSPVANNISILPHDSIWLFVDVLINPSTSSMIVNDQIKLEINKSIQYISLVAFGWNIYLHKAEFINTNTVWKADKPHVILHKNEGKTTIPGVIVSENIKLTIQKGTKLFFSNNASILINGTLEAIGSKSEKIEMGGLRLEKDYQKAAGQWLGLLFARKSKGNVISNVILDESIYGIWMGFDPSNNIESWTNDTRAEISIDKTIVSNAYLWALRSNNSLVKATNSLFFTSTDYTCQLNYGGKYEFRNCTFFNSQSKELKETFLMSNSIFNSTTNKSYSLAFDNSIFENCIVWSSNSNAILLNIDQNNSSEDIVFENCAIKTTNVSNLSFLNCFININPEFENVEIDKENFKLKSNSLLIDNGVDNSLIEDLDQNIRPSGNKIDIGCYEFQR